MSDHTKQKNNETAVLRDLPVPRAVAALAVPTVITQLINIIYNFADTWFVGRTGNPAMVAATSVSMPIFVIMAAIANLFGIGGASVISRSLGEQKPEKARKVFAFSFYGGLAAAVLYMIFMGIFGPHLILVIGGDENSYAYIRSYMFWTMVVGAVPTVGNVLCGHLVRSVGASKEAGIGMSMGGILNCALDPLFMFVLLPPGNEVTGAGIATMLSNTAAFVYFIVFFLRRRGHQVFTLNPKDVSFGGHIPGDVFAVGLPAALSTTLAMVSNIFANALVSDYGTEAVTGMGVAKKVNMLAFNTAMGITQGVLPLIGYSFGAKNEKRLRETFRFTAVVVLIVTLAAMTLFLVFDEQLIRFFIDEDVSVNFGKQFLRVIAFASPIASVCYLIGTVFQASGWKIQSLILSIMRKGLVDIPLMFVFRHFMGAVGITVATPVAECISSGVAVVLMRQYWRDVFPKDPAEHT